MHDISHSARVIRETVAGAASRSGREPDDIEIMIVTKTHPREIAEAAFNEGFRLFGENRVAEAMDKYAERAAGTKLHLIGHLQRNKARDAALTFDCIESIDKRPTVEALLRFLPDDRKPYPVLLEMNTSGETTKSGVPDRDALFRLVDELLSLESLRLCGLMTIAPFTDDEIAVRRSFSKLREALESVRNRYDLPDCSTLSMGMSTDYEWAIEEGANRVRIGTALFGHREA